MSILTKHYRPIAKLQQLIDLKRARFPIGKGIRAGISIGLTFALGLLSGYALEGLFVCIASLCFTGGEASNLTYRAMFKQTLIASSIGGLGAFAGVFAGLPWSVTIIIMTILAFICSIVSNYGMAYSVGTMIALVLTSVVIGIPIEGMELKMFICFQIGTAFYLSLLGCEALIDSHRPERQLLSNHIKTLAAYARTKSQQLSESQTDSVKIQISLDTALDSYFTLYSALLNSTYHNSPERARETDKQAATLQALDSVLSHLIAVDNDAGLLSNSAEWLDTIAEALDNKSKVAPKLPSFFKPTAGLFYGIDRLSGHFWSSSPASPSLTEQKQIPGKISIKEKIRILLRHLIVGKEATIVALVFAACMGAAFATKYFITANHWYWVPLTVALTMKPDFGSVFSRAITRSTGTVFGAIIGTLILIALPKGLALVISVGVLAALMPWAKMISYTTQVVVITAILLVLLDLLNTTPVTVDYAGQRVGDTILASVIILIFSYVIWPRNKHEELSERFHNILHAIKNYLTAACQNDNNDKNEFKIISIDVFKKKIIAYQALSELRVLLHRLAVEPAPVGTEAASWLPLVSGAERLCDKISIYFTNRTVGSAIPNSNDVNYLLNNLEMILESKKVQTEAIFSEQYTDQLKSFLFDINEEINSLSKLLQKNKTDDPPMANPLVKHPKTSSAAYR